MTRVRVEGHPNLYRDEQTGAIINTDVEGYENYVKELNNREKEKQEFNQMKDEIQEIKSLLKQLLSEKNGSI